MIGHALVPLRGRHPAKDLSVDLLTGDAAITGLGVTIAAALFASAGAGLGALVRSEALAIIAAVAWWFVIEGLLPRALREPGLASRRTAVRRIHQ
ncbi:hypothetical protein ACIBL3_44500 [Kribbella sp. NPDC050124]|uniref:hypothetical protein n=1 Tax=Kribbella sp. NPDC050124 TaxID=3364114 RepID=UPI0037983743